MLLFFDIDGTIWDYKNYIPKSAITAIKKAQKNGHKCLINTGRARAFVKEQNLLDIGFDGIVSACGCMVELDNKVVFNHLISIPDCIRTIETIRRHGFRTILEGPNYLYMDLSEFQGDMYASKVIAEMGDQLLGITDQWGQWEINKLSCACDTPTRDACFAELSDLYDYMIHSEAVVEIVPKGFHKGTGILEVCKILNVDVKDTIAFGDSANDIPMFDTAGTSVVMGRSSEEARAHADLITDTLEEDGIEHAMIKLGLI